MNHETYTLLHESLKLQVCNGEITPDQFNDKMDTLKDRLDRFEKAPRLPVKMAKDFQVAYQAKKRWN